MRFHGHLQRRLISKEWNLNEPNLLITGQVTHLDFDQDGTEHKGSVFSSQDPPCFAMGPVNANVAFRLDVDAISAVRMFSRSHKSCFQMLSPSRHDWNGGMSSGMYHCLVFCVYLLFKCL